MHRFEQLWRDGERAAFAIECGSGTYVRSLIADLGDAYCLELRRTGIGPFDVADAGRFVPLGEALTFLPAVELEGEDARRAAHGVAVRRRSGWHRPARRRRRADRARRAARRRHAQARRRLPRLMQVTWLPDAVPRPRHVAVGEFDGVHRGHREVMRGADTVLTFEPHPRAVVSPDTAPKLLTSLETKADLIAGLGVEELVVIPFDGAFASREAQDFIDERARRPARRRARQRRPELPLRPPREGRRRGCCRRRTRSRRASSSWSSSTARSSPRRTSAAWSRAA